MGTFPGYWCPDHTPRLCTDPRAHPVLLWGLYEGPLKSSGEVEARAEA